MSHRRSFAEKGANGVHARKLCLQLARNSGRSFQGGSMEQGPRLPSVSRRAAASTERGGQERVVGRLCDDEEAE